MREEGLEAILAPLDAATGKEVNSMMVGVFWKCPGNFWELTISDYC